MSRLTIAAAVALTASTAWPCSGEPCSERSVFSTIDGGVPVNLQPLVVRGVWFTAPAVQLTFADGGPIATQVHTSAAGDLLIDSAALVEGESYVLQRAGSCSGLGGADAGFVEPFTVLPAADLGAPIATIAVNGGGIAGINQYAGAACSAPVQSSFVNFQFSVDPTRADLLPFVRWSLVLAPLDGGARITWKDEGVGALLADGGLDRVVNAQLAPPRISQIWHVCPGGTNGFPTSLGAPAGHYRAELVGRFLDGDAGATSVSGAFELVECRVGGADGGADGGEPDGGDITPTPDAGGATDGGTTSQPPPAGCSSVGAEWLPWLLLLVMRRRR